MCRRSHRSGRAPWTRYGSASPGLSERALGSSHDNFVFPALGPASTNLQAVAERIGALVPQYIVDGEGAFLRIHDVNRMKALLDSMMTQLLGPIDPGPARQALESMLSTEALTGLAAQDWNAIVGMWAGADLELGEVYEMEEQTPLPMLPGAVVPMVSEFSIEGRTSCVDGGSDRNLSRYSSWQSRTRTR